MPRRRRLGRPALVVSCAALLLAAPAAAAPGDLDAGFATGGVHTASFMTTFPGQEDSHKVAIDSLGRVVVAATLEGQLNGGLPRSINVYRLTPQGQPDATFAGGGVVTLPVAGDTYLGGLVIDGQDRPIIAGTSGAITTSQIALVRLTTTGVPDTSFSGDGQAVAALPALIAGPQVTGLAIDAAGGLLVSGIAYSGGVPYTRTFFVARYSSGGDLDTGYGAGGWRQIGSNAPGARELSSIVALSGGGAVVAGFDDNWFVTRLTAGGALDPTFDGDGTATSTLGKGVSEGVSNYGLAVDGTGRPIVVGQFTGSLGARWALARWTSTGAPDPGFGTGSPAAGVVLGPANHYRLNDVDLQCDGRILVTGIALRADQTDNAMAVARYTDGGVLDATFAPAATVPGIARVEAGAKAVGSDLGLTATAATAVGFRRANVAPEGVRDLPIVARLAKDDSCAGAPAAPSGPAAATPGAPPPPAPAKAAALPSFSSLATLPGTKACVSRRRFSIRLRVPRDSSVTSADVKVNGRSVAVRRGARLRSVVNLTKLPKGRFRVQITMRLADGRTVKGTRTYRTCAPKRRGNGGPRV